MICLHGYMHTLHYIGLHSLRCITYITWDDMTLHQIVQINLMLLYSAVHSISFYSIVLHYIKYTHVHLVYSYAYI